MYFSTLLTLAAAVPATLAFPWHHQAASSSDSKRATTSYAASDATLYAYGTNISGWPLFYGANDGLVYLSPSANATAGLHNVTWDIPSMSDTDSASTAAKLTNGSTAGYLWLDVANGAFDNVQVLPANSNHTGVTTGITVFGKQVVYYNGSSIQSEFWAKQDATSGLWALHWNSDNESQDGTTPVVIKTA